MKIENEEELQLQMVSLGTTVMRLMEIMPDDEVLREVLRGMLSQSQLFCRRIIELKGKKYD